MRKRKPTLEAEQTPRRRAAADEEPRDVVFTSAPPWLISLILHCGTLLLIGLAAVEVHRQTGEEMDVELAPLEEFGDELYAETLGEQLETPQPAYNPSLAAEVGHSYSISDLPPVLDPLAAPPLSDQPLAPGDGFFSAVEAPSIGWALSGRQEGRKDALLRAYGGTKTTQDAVDLALRWIAAQQRRDGFWSLRGPYAGGSSGENEVAATAMALLAFLGDGHTHVRKGPYQQTVNRGMRALIKVQGEEGEFVSRLAQQSHSLYTHAQCTIVMCELYAITQDSLVREVAQRAVNYCVKIQASEGGWRYQPARDSDTSVTGWFVMALSSARMAHLEVPSLTLSRVGKYLDSVGVEDGSRYRYQPERPPTPPMTAEALLCRQYLGWERDDKRLQAGVEYLSRYPVDWSEPNVYHWYYATQVMHHMGGPDWVAWNKVMRQVIPENQEHAGPERGSWDPGRDAWGAGAGRLYMTCLSTYMLEVYYRHLPLYSLPKPAETATESVAADEAAATR